MACYNPLRHNAQGPAGWLLLILLTAGCLSTRDVERIRANPVESATVTLPLEAVSMIQGSMLDGSVSGDGSLWFLDGQVRGVWMLPPDENAPRRMPLMDETGQSLLDPGSIDASAGLSVLIADRTLNRVFRYDRSGALLAAWSVPLPGPADVEVPLARGEQGARAALGALTATTGDRVAILDRNAPRLYLVDEQAGDARIVSLPSAASTVTFHAGRLVLVSQDGLFLFLVSTSGVLEQMVDIGPVRDGLRFVDAASVGGAVYLLSAEGSLWHIHGLGHSGMTDPPRIAIFQPSPDTDMVWTALVATPDAMWWLGNGPVHRSARPR